MLFDEFIVSLHREEDNSPKENETPKDVPCEMMEDIELEYLIKEVKESIVSLNDDREKYAALARSEQIQSSSVDANWFALLYCSFKI